MDVIKSISKRKDTLLGIGDLIEWHPEDTDFGGFYLVINQDNLYVAKNLNGYSGLFGVFESLEELNKGFYERELDKECTIYKADDYALQVVERKGI